MLEESISEFFWAFLVKEESHPREKFCTDDGRNFRHRIHARILRLYAEREYGSNHGTFCYYGHVTKTSMEYFKRNYSVVRQIVCSVSRIKKRRIDVSNQNVC